MNRFLKLLTGSILAAGVLVSSMPIGQVYAETAVTTFDAGTFTNTYTADPVSAEAEFTKSLINASNKNAAMEMTAGEFNFDVEWTGTDFYKGGDPSSREESGEKTKAYSADSSGTDALYRGTFDSTVTNDAEGKIKVVFTINDPGSELGYGEGDHAVYHYTVQEKAGNNNHIKYSSGIGKVDVTVSRSGSTNSESGQYELDGKLVKGNVTVTAPEGGTFVNTYTADSVSVQFTASKVLTGKALKANEYEFQLSGDSIATQNVKNAADGKINFAAVKYENAGDYSVTIREVVPEKKDAT